MRNFLAVYSIAEEKIRLKFGAAICEIDEHSVDVIDDHAIVFRSDKELTDLHKILVSSCIHPRDEAWIIDFDERPHGEERFTGNGIALDDLREFFKR